MSENLSATRRIDPNLHAGLTGAESGGHALEPWLTDGIGDGTFAVLLFAVEGLEVTTGNDVMVAVYAAPGFEQAQNCLDARRRVERPLDVEWFVVLAEDKLLIAIRRGDAAENATRLFVIGGRSKPEPLGITDRVLGQLARRLRGHLHRVPFWEETIYEAFLVIGDTGELVESRVFDTLAKYVEEEKSSLDAAIAFRPAHDEIAAARIEKVGGTQCFGKMLHMTLRYKMWWWQRKKFLQIVGETRPRIAASTAI
jgi:hypothetical protein